MTRPRKFGPSTKAVHGRPATKPEGSPVAKAIVQSSTFVNLVGEDGDLLYTRYGNNPNQVDLGGKLALLEGAEAGIFVASGMGATALAHMAVLGPGDHLISSDWIYGGTRKLFAEEFSRLGIDTTFVNPAQERGWRRYMRKNTRAVFVEAVSNPLMRVLNIDPLAKLCHGEGLALLVDSTFATPINFRPLERGADAVIHSATKYLNGHSDVIAGAVAGTEAFVEEVRERMKVWGQALDPHAAWLTDRGLKTLAVRMQRHNSNGLAFAQWAQSRSEFSTVHYPGLESHPDHGLATDLLSGFSGLVGLQVKGGVRATERFLRRLRLATHAPSLGGVETLVSEPRLTSHASLSAAERNAQGIPDGFVRVSLGVEDIDDIIADFEHALSS